MAKTTIMFLGNAITFKLRKFDYRKVFSDDCTDTLVQYDEETDTITVDTRASHKYVKYAAIHECICCGDYAYLAPQTDNPADRCKSIDWLIIAAMPEYDRKNYVQKRKEMFSTLLRKHLNPNMEESFKRSLEMLEEAEKALN